MAHYWFAFDWISYDEKTRDLSLVEHGAYIQLLKHYYSTGSPLPVENEKLARICGAHSTDEISALAMVLRRYFYLELDGWHNKRCDEEIAKRNEISNKRSRFGKRGGLAKAKANAMANGLANDQQNDTHLTTNSNTKPKVKSVVHFVHPTLEEVSQYCRERGNQVNAQHWIDHYSANGWKVGRNPMKDWRAAVRNWERNGALGGSHGASKQATQQRQPTRQVERFHNNLAEIQREFGDAAMGVAAGADGPGQAPRLSAGNTPLLEGEVRGLPRR